MGVAWTGEQVLALAPDASSVSAGRALARASAWSGTGASDAPAVVWGQCQGSGRTPYVTIVDLAGPAFRCTCPSRKFPCKHALGLLLLWSAGGVAEAAPPAPVTTWLDERASRGRRPSAASDGDLDAAGGADGETDAEADARRAEAAARRAEQRDARMAAGLQDLQRWLLDQLRGGLAGRERAGYAEFDAVAARLVDAQVPAVAAAVRRLPAVLAGGEQWPARLLEEYALLHLLARAHDRLAADTDDQDGSALRDSLRAHLGVSVREAAVLATAPTRDQWTVLALRDTEEERLTTRTVWVAGRNTGRVAVVLSFAPVGQSLDATLVPGHTWDADVHWYPGAAALRATFGTRHAHVEHPEKPLPATDLDGAFAAWSHAVARDPWLRSWPVVLDAAVLVRSADGRWWLEDGSGAAAPASFVGGADPWELVAAGGGHELPVLVEVDGRGVRPLAVLAGERVTARTAA